MPDKLFELAVPFLAFGAREDSEWGITVKSMILLPR